MPVLGLLDTWSRYSVYAPWFFSGGLVFALISYFVGNTKGHGCLGCFLGAFLGPFGVLITALLGPRNSV